MFLEHVHLPIVRELDRSSQHVSLHAHIIFARILIGRGLSCSFTTFQAEFKMKVQHGVFELRFVSEDAFVFHNKRELRVLLFRHFYSTFADFNSNIKSLKKVAPGLVMATFEVWHSHLFTIAFITLLDL